MVTWITGNSGAGKTYLAVALQKKYGGIILDGDCMRALWPELGFSEEDRKENNIRIANIASALSKLGYDIIVATICPYRDLRKKVQKITNCKFVYVEGGKSNSEEYPYESEMI